MDTKKIESLQAQLSRAKKIIKDTLGEGIWGLNKKENNKFTHEEIIFVFARIFSALGFEHVIKVRQGFPDCICYQEGKEVGVEFEPYLSSFRIHITKQDDLNSCQFIICWEDDLEIYDSLIAEIKAKHIEVIELKKIYEEQKISNRFSKTVITHSDIEKFTSKQLNVLQTFILSGKDILTKEEIAKGIGIVGKGLGGALKGFAESNKKLLDWVLRQTPEGTWELNPKHKKNVIAALKKWDRLPSVS